MEQENNSEQLQTKEDVVTAIQNEVAKLDELNSEDAEPCYTISAYDLILGAPDEIPCLLEPILPTVGLVALAGSSDTGKSCFLRELGVCISAGFEQFLDWKLNAKHKSVLYVSTEDDEQSIGYLLRRQNKDKHLAATFFKGLRYMFDTSDLLKKLDSELTRQPADLVVIDAFGDLYSGRMNDAANVRTFLHDYHQIAQRHKCLVMFLHHTGKRTEELTPSKHNLLGSQAFEAKMRLVIEMRADPQDDSIVHLCIVKGNYLPKEMKNDSFVLKFSQNLTFENTGSRTNFLNLNQPDAKNKKLTMALQLQAQGKNQTEIAKEMGTSKSTISRMFKQVENPQNDDLDFLENSSETNVDF
jgi:archaellum biogenesis ATPase FlaH/DNA-binding phage protein